jgi:hypothetical protein
MVRHRAWVNLQLQTKDIIDRPRGRSIDRSIDHRMAVSGWRRPIDRSRARAGERERRAEARDVDARR